MEIRSAAMPESIRLCATSVLFATNRSTARHAPAIKQPPLFPRRAIPAPDPRRALSFLFLISCRRYELAQFFVFQPDGSSGHLRNQRAAIAVEKPAAQEKILKPAPWHR